MSESVFEHSQIDEEDDPEKVFELIEKLGEGSYGCVWKAAHKRTKMQYAVKRVPVDNDLDELAREIEFMKQCRSPFILRYYGSYFKNSELWIVMEYCAAGSVSDLMKVANSVLREDQIAIVLKYVLEGLQYLHERHKLHRDIKAGNILLTDAGQGKLGDFGVSGQLADTMAKRHTVIGTPFWMAPEVIQEVGYNEKADVWSLGITAIELAEGKPPYANVHPMRAIFMIPSRPPPTLTEPAKWTSNFNDFVAKCLVKNPTQRPSAKELLTHPFIVGAISSPSPLLPLLEKQKKVLASIGREKALGLDHNEENASTRHIRTRTMKSLKGSAEKKEGGGGEKAEKKLVKATVVSAGGTLLQESPEEDGDEDTGTMRIVGGTDTGSFGSSEDDGTMVINHKDDDKPEPKPAWMVEKTPEKTSVPLSPAPVATPPSSHANPVANEYSTWTTSDLKKAIREIDEQKDKDIKSVVERYAKYKQAVIQIIEDRKKALGKAPK